MATPDVTIRGGGILGLSVAWVCARRGARVRVIETAGIGAGASGGPVGALAPHVPDQWNAKKQFQFDSLIMAEGFWQSVAAAGGGDPGHARTGRLQPLADADAVALARARAAQAAVLWQGQAVWVVEAAAGAADWLPDGGSGYMVRDTLSGRIAPRAALAALAAALRASGAEITLGEASVGGAVIHATGVQGLHALGAGSGVKGQAALLAHDARGCPQLLVEGLHIVPHADGTVAVGSTTERDFTDARQTDGALEVLIARARAACPALADARVLSRWAGLRPRARSRAPIVGPWPGRPGHFVINGGFKIGFGMAPKLAEVLADLVLDGRNAIPEDFRPVASP